MFNLYNYGEQPQQQGHHHSEAPHEQPKSTFVDSAPPHYNQHAYNSSLSEVHSSSALSDTLPAFSFLSPQNSMTQQLHLPHLQQTMKQHGNTNGLSYHSLHSIRHDDGQLAGRSENGNSLDHHFDSFSSMDSPQTMVPNFANSSHMSSVYNSVDIDSIVHSPVMSVPDMPTTLPPLHSGSVNTPMSMAMHLSLPTPLEHSPQRTGKLSPRPNRERAPWTPEEDNLLRLAVQLYGDNTEKWAKIAACVPGRTNKNCRKRWFHSLDPSLRKGAWTDEEDQLLREGVTKYPNQWSKIADMLEGRTDDQCAKRWRESLDPNIDRSDWTAEEDRKLLDKFQTFGSQWQRISQFFDGRPGLHCRNRWRKLQRMVQSRQDKDDLVITTAASYATLHDEPMTRYRHSHPVDHRSSQSSLRNHMGTTSPITPTGSTSSSPANPHSNSHQQDPSVLAQFQTNNHIRSSHPGLDETMNDEKNDVNPYGCDVGACTASFPSSTGLFYHIKNSHPQLEGVEKPYRCGMPGCAKKYKNLNGLQYHLRDAKGNSRHDMSTSATDTVDERPFRCEIPGCKKRYRTVNGQRYHQTHGHNLAPMPLEEIQSQSFRMRNEKWLFDNVKDSF